MRAYVCVCVFVYVYVCMCVRACAYVCVLLLLFLQFNKLFCLFFVYFCHRSTQSVYQFPMKMKYSNTEIKIQSNMSDWPNIYWT